MWKCVVVDDDFQVVQGLRKFIEESGLDIQCVGTAGDGKEALEVIRKVKPNIVMTDVSMPVMDGLEMVESLRSEGYPGEIVILSGYADFQYAQQAIRFHVSDYLLKPITLADLHKVLDKVVSSLGDRHSVSVDDRGWYENSRHRETVDVMLRYIQDNYNHDINLEDMSKLLFLSSNNLNQIFKRDTGETFTNYLIRFRMEKAKELLLEGKYFVYEVAERVGYKNMPYFSNIFRKYTGHKPSELFRPCDEFPSAKMLEAEAGR